MFDRKLGFALHLVQLLGFDCKTHNDQILLVLGTLFYGRLNKYVSQLSNLNLPGAHGSNWNQRLFFPSLFRET